MNTPDFIAWLGERLDRIEHKVDEGRAHLSQVDVTLAKQAADVEHHIRRTDLLETRVEQIATDVRPIREHVLYLRGIGWFLVALAGVASAVATLKGLIL